MKESSSNVENRLNGVASQRDTREEEVTRVVIAPARFKLVHPVIIT